jgi:hypothetical protein
MTQQSISPDSPLQRDASERMRARLHPVIAADSGEVREGDPGAAPPSAPAQPGPRYEELRLDGDATFLTLYDREGGAYECEIAPLTMDRIEHFSWLQNQVEILHNRMLATSAENAQQFERAKERSSRAKKALILFVATGYPADKFGQMTGSSYMRIVKLTEEMRKEATGEGDGPNR